MGEALFELEQILRSSKYSITREEEDVLSMCKGKAVKNFTFSSLISSAVAWIAFGKFGYGFRVNLTGGAGLVTGMYRFDRSLYSCVENILAMDGTRLQAELANVIITKHRHDPRTMQCIQKHLYSEKVFDDASDQPSFRWRQRNFFNDDVARSQRSPDNDTNDNNTRVEKKQPSEPEQFSVQPSIELSSDALDCVFGYSVSPEEIRHPNTTIDNATKRRARSHKRSHRRHRTQHAEVLQD